MRYSNRAVRSIAFAALLPWIAACDDSGLDAGTVGKVQFILRDAPGTTAPAYQGSLTTNANAFIAANGTQWVQLGSPNGITVKLQNADSTNVHGAVDAPVGTYTRVRLVLRDVEVVVKAGASVGGITLTSDVTLAVGGTDREVVIETQVAPFVVTENDRVTVDIRLDSGVWINAQNLQTRTVSDAAIIAAATIAVKRSN